MFISRHGLRPSVFGIVLSVCFLGFATSTMAWVEPPKDYPDVKIFESGGSGAAVAFDPSNSSRLVVSFSASNGCLFRRSTNGGKTWGASLPLPQLPGANCSGPVVVAYETDGSQLYAGYTYYDDQSHWGVAFSVSSDHGVTWSILTTTSLPEVTNGCGYLDVAVAPDAPSVYVTATCSALGVQKIYFGSSDNGGLSWSPLRVISPGGAGDPGWYHGSLAIGHNGAVLVAYGQYFLDGKATVVVARSKDGGASFSYGNATQLFGQDDPYSSPLQPQIAIGSSGRAHLVYTRRVGTSLAILYKSSVPPYEAWNAQPKRLDDGKGNVAGTPRIAVSACEDTSILHVSWQEVQRPKLLYQEPINKIRYRRKLEEPGYRWSYPLSVSKTTRLIVSEFSHLAAGGAKAFSTFQSFSFSDYHFRILGTPVWSGITCRE